MRSRRIFSLALLVCATLAGPARESRAVATPVTGTLALTIAGLPAAEIAVSGSVVVNGSGAGPHLDTLAVPAGLIQAAGLVFPVTDPAAYPLNGVQLTVSNAAGTGTGPSLLMPLFGLARICLFLPCTASPPANLSVPLSVVGVGGTVSVNFPINVTVIGAPWTTGTATIASLTQMGFREGPLGSASSTLLPSGRIGFVTPVFMSTNIGSSPIMPVFASLTLHFVPEQGTLVSIGGGLVALAAAGRRRMRRR